MRNFCAIRFYVICILCLGILSGNLIHASKRVITKRDGSSISSDLTPVSDGDTVVIINDTINSSDWWTLKTKLITTSFSLELETPNQFVPDYALNQRPNLKSIKMPNVKALGISVFSETGVTNAYLPNVETIGTGAFFKCPALVSASLPKVKIISRNTFYECSGLADVDISLAEAIIEQAFYGCTALTDINLPYVKTIGNNAFHTCSSLETVYLPKVETIGNNAFINCAGLINLDLPEAKTISEQGFQYCKGLISLNLPKAEIIQKNAFALCSKLKNVSLPEVVSVGNNAFEGCAGLVSADLPLVETIGNYVFQNCSELKTINLPKVQTMGAAAFENCVKLTSFSFPELLSIGNGTFYGCTGLTYVNLRKVLTLGNAAFQNCSNIEIMLLHNISTIGNAAFDNCTSLKYMELGEPPVIQSNAFSRVGRVLIVAPDTNAYKPFPLPAPYSTGSEVHLRRVSTESRMFRPDSLETLIPLRNPNPALAAGGTFVWKKDGYPISGASGNSYTPTSPGWYTLDFTHGGTVTLLSVYLAAETVEVPDSRARFVDCTYMLVLTFTPSAADRTVTVSTRGSAAAYVMDAASEKLFKDGVTFKLPKNKTMLEIPYEVVPEMGNDNQVQFVWEVSDFPIVYDTDVFTLYDKHTITHRYIRPTIGFSGLLEVEITGGSPYIERSRDGGETWEWARDPVTGATLPFSQSQINNIDVPYLIFRQSNTCTPNDTIRLYDDSDPSIIMRTVSIPAVTDAVCSLEEGVYPVESRKDFTFTLTGLKADYVPQVSTSRVLLPDSEGLQTVRNADGSYTITILSIQEETIVTIDFTVGNETIESARVWAADGMLYLQSDNAGEIYVYTLSGTFIQRVSISAGETSRLPLAKGCYIVTIGRKTYKVVL